MSKVEFTAGNWNPFESLRVPNNSNALLAGHGGMSKRHLKNAQALMDQHHKNVMEHLQASYGHETQFQTHLSGLREAEAGGAHSRNMEFASFIHKGAEGGTGVNLNLPGGASASYTRKQRKSRTKPTETPTGNFPPVKVADEPQQEPPAATTNPAATSGASVGRDPKTGRAISLKNASSTKAAPKKSSQTKAGPSVQRNPKTGRAQSIKKA